MKRRNLVYASTAEADLLSLHSQIASASSFVIATRYIERIEAFCASFDLAAERGAARDDLMPGLRIVGFERRITIAFTVDDETVTFLRFFYGGQDWDSAFD
ncbi:MAG: type II toxin-antitoxin system RelE/ParE family toxin [Roseitalea sp.]|mgnify:CR=1 FL=1|jgi:toxin ParE1/3/4|uniref:type II toxin-antitoxin system RelE/ParE family toxin n=1 Tax=Oceaniradius stylonematis TaxID=2184161 RepID=UPI000F4081DB|nr:type II toxin-antitoxin system RelE/ParE family toxin [Oceaniradius stylonematis]MBO6553161.1 type II toxin-antitoxin system RelE/ParE family toxin [Roseitalea sp.]MBO6951079.1 type II toxin-antitoxin system RelE/ParE family toxin [Rhizobiaceae bacterium]RNC93888.1 MAG: type II toxin-antitoxin system RelE/ParE family toxin [Oricola sp.]MBO6590934.1 type II toxin-antitoxin system RelE/ParE family toxin [Roseitalea sp.]MBO6599808.1 type II toxin-antitoxin system RelE/ParE family toxin [Roseit